MPRALVTGAGGFVGAALARRLLADGHEVVLLRRPGGDPWRLEQLRGQCQILEVDLVDRAAVHRAVTGAQPAWVFHVAAHGAYSWQTDAAAMVQVNVAGALHVAEAALHAGCEAFVATGSSSEYGYKDHPPAEDEPVEPNSVYAATKAGATLLLQHLARAHDAHVVTLRLYSVYGPWEDPRRLMPQLVILGREGRLPPLVGPDVGHDFVYVDDVVDALLAAAGRTGVPRGAVYNVGSGRQTTLREVVETARAVLGIAAEPAWGTMADRAWDTRVWVADPRRAADELGWSAHTELRDGLARFSAWMAGDPDRLRPYAATVSRADDDG